MAKLTITVGLPGSGKTHWAMDYRYERAKDYPPKTIVIVSKDDIRSKLEEQGWVWSQKNEKDVLRHQERLISEALTQDLDVIAADTNFGSHPERLKQLARQYGAEFEIKDFTHVPIDTCIQRDLKRTGKAHVGEKVIRDMAEKYLTPRQLVQRTGEPQFFLDLDGVLADFDGFIEKELGIVNNRANERDDFWDIARGYTGRLYFDMEPLPHAAELYARLRELHPIILTGCPYSIKSAAQDKREWVAKYIDPHIQVVTCKSRNKSNYLVPGDVLLDDWEKHRPAWEAKGGKWVTFTGNVDKAVTDVTEALKAIDRVV